MSPLRGSRLLKVFVRRLQDTSFADEKIRVAKPSKELLNDGTGKQMRHIKIRNMSDDHPAIRAYLQEAVSAPSLT